jgi:hypothetical protein
VWLTWAAQSLDAGTPTWLTLINFGVLGLVLFFTFFKPKIHTASEVARLVEQVQRERSRAEVAEAENVRLHMLVEEQVIPALSRSTDLIAKQIGRPRGRDT